MAQGDRVLVVGFASGKIKATNNIRGRLDLRRVGRLPEIEGDKEPKKRFKSYPIGFFHIDIAELQTAQGKLYLFVAIIRP